MVFWFFFPANRDENQEAVGVDHGADVEAVGDEDGKNILILITNREIKKW